MAFVKGTRRQPQCGFSYKVLSMLNELGANYEVLNVLDETYNPGLREAIKEYSQWPTIPQVRYWYFRAHAVMTAYQGLPLSNR